MKKLNFFPFILSASFFLVGFLLLNLKLFFGYPYLMESLIMFGFGICMSFLSLLNMKFNILVEHIAALVESITKLLIPQTSMPNITGDIKQINVVQDQDGNVTTNATPEELEIFKNNPMLSSMFAPISEMLFSKLGNISLEKMSEKKLDEELKKAVEKEDFERAEAIKKEKEKRKNL